MTVPYRNLVEENGSVLSNKEDLANEKERSVRENFHYIGHKIKSDFSETKFCVSQKFLICNAISLVSGLLCIIVFISIVTNIKNTETKRVIYNPVVRGPAKMPQSPLCSGIQYLDCGYSWDELSVFERHTKSVNKIIGNFLSKDTFKSVLHKSTAVKQAKTALNICIRETSKHDSNGTEVLASIKDFLEEVNLPAPIFGISTTGTEKSSPPVTVLSNILAKLQVESGLDTLFRFEVLSNPYKSHKRRTYMLYLEPKVDYGSNDYAEFLLKEISMKNMPPKESLVSVKNILNIVSKLNTLKYDIEDSSQWRSVSINEARDEWSWFDFKEYFLVLFKDFPELQRAILHPKFTFVVKAPKYLHDLQKLIYRNDDFGDLLGYLILIQNLQFMGKREEYESRIRNFRIGHLTKPESPSQNCVNDIKNYLPYLASIIYQESFSEHEITRYENAFIDAFKKVVFQLETMLQTSFLKSAENIKNYLQSKIQTISIIFDDILKNLTTIEYFHENLKFEEDWNYFSSKKELRRFKTYKKLKLLLNNHEEAFELNNILNTLLLYSRIGNWIYVPTEFLISPIVINKTHIPILYWMIGREISKAIDSEGINWDFEGARSNGQSKNDPIVSTQQKCLLHHTIINDSITIKQVINEAIGLETALKLFEEEKSKLRTEKEKFFKSIQPFYCSNEHPSSVMILLEKYLDYMMKREEAFGCNFFQINMNCPIWVSPT